MRVVGDGYSSVFARIREEIPGWGRYVTKEECESTYKSYSGVF
jgi:hypothetical protein